MLELEGTLHLRNETPLGLGPEIEWLPGDDEADVLIHVDTALDGGKHEVLKILRDFSGDGDWEEIKIDSLPQSVTEYIDGLVDDESERMAELAVQA